MLYKYKANKKDILISLNTDKRVVSDNILIKALDGEFKKIQEFIYNLDRYDHLKEEKKNKKGSLLNKILCITENEILEKVEEKLGCDFLVPMFDGFLGSIDLDIQNTLELLNKTTCAYGIEWAHKEHDQTIKMDENVIIPEDIISYETAKINFELNNFMIEHPVIFGREEEMDDNKQVFFYTKADFTTLNECHQYTEENGKEKPLFLEWLKDKDKRIYKRLDFIPTFEEVKGVYNTFTGFNYLGTKPNGHPIIQGFINHLYLLAGEELEAHNYLIKYIAHLIQKPHELPRVMLLFKSGEGVGKDMMIDYIEKILGSSYIYRTEDLDTIFGGFNGSLKNKLVLQINELQGADGYKQKEKLKNLSTAVHHNIRELYCKSYKETNYLRIFIFTNNLSPVDIPHDDRRYCVFKCGKKKKKEYYKTMYNYLRDDKGIEELVGYFKEVDIEDFDPTDRPKTEAYETMRESNIHPIYKYLYNNFKGDEYKTEFEDSLKVHKKTGLICISPEEFKYGFKCYLEQIESTFIRHDYKTLHLLMKDLGIPTENIKIGGNPNRKKYFMINKPDLIELLEEKGITEAENNFDGDEFE